MQKYVKAIKSVLTVLTLLLLVVGTVWPTSLNVFLPEKWHYETWPLALKIATWGIVFLLFIWDSSGKGRDRGDISKPHI